MLFLPKWKPNCETVFRNLMLFQISQFRKKALAFVLQCIIVHEAMKNSYCVLLFKDHFIPFSFFFTELEIYSKKMFYSDSVDKFFHWFTGSVEHFNLDGEKWQNGYP